MNTNTFLSNNDESCKIATQDPTLRIAQGTTDITKDDCIHQGFCYDDSIPNIPYCFKTGDKTNSYVLSLETLTKKYDAILIQYRQAYADYIQYLEQNPNTPSYSLLTANGQNNTVCSGGGNWNNTNGFPKWFYNVTNEQCASECDNNPNCTAYDLVNQSDNRYQCAIFGNQDIVPATANIAYGCYKKVNKTNFLTAVQGQTYWGTGAISGSQVNTVEQCKALCSADGNCSGATFNQDKQMCWTRSGEGQLVEGLPTDYAIVKEDAQHLTTLNMFNQQLTDINQQILKMVNDGEPLYKEQRENRATQSGILTDNLKSLLEERAKINAVLQTYNDYDEEVLEEEIDINYYYWLMLIFSVIIILSVIFLVRISVASSNSFSFNSLF